MANVHAPETKAQVIAEWKAGASANNLAQRYNVPRATIQLWVKSEERVALTSGRKKTDLSGYDLDSMAVDLVDGSVRAVTAIYAATQDEAWLKRQNASDLAVLAGVISDKLYRLLSAVRPPEQPTTNDEG